MSKPIKIALIGCGNWGVNILRDLILLKTIVTVVVRSSQSKERAQKAGAKRIVGDIRDIGSVDGYVVATPASVHAKTISQLLSLNPHAKIFCEKPLTNDLHATKQLVALASNQIFVMDKWRYHPGILELAKIAKNGQLGKVIGLKTVRLSWGTLHDDVDCIWTLAPHDIAIALEILGKIPEPLTAIADIKDTGQVVGLIGILGKKPWFHMEVSERYPVSQRETRLFCEKGSAILNDSYADTIQVVSSKSVKFGQPKIQRRPIAITMPLFNELEAFVLYLQGGLPPKSSAKEALRNVETIYKLRRLAGINV